MEAACSIPCVMGQQAGRQHTQWSGLLYVTIKQQHIHTYMDLGEYVICQKKDGFISHGGFDEELMWYVQNGVPLNIL